MHRNMMTKKFKLTESEAYTLRATDNRSHVPSWELRARTEAAEKELRIIPSPAANFAYNRWVHVRTGDLYVPERACVIERPLAIGVQYCCCRTGVVFCRPLSEFLDKFKPLERW